MEGAGRRYLLLGALGMPLRQTGSIVLRCVEGVIMAVEGERSYCSAQSSGDTGTLLMGSLRRCCRDSRAGLQGHRVQCAQEVAPCQGQP